MYCTQKVYHLAHCGSIIILLRTVICYLTDDDLKSVDQVLIEHCMLKHGTPKA